VERKKDTVLLREGKEFPGEMEANKGVEGGGPGEAWD